MPWGLQRFQQTGHSHFVTFSCYRRRPLFTTDAAKRIFENALERVRRSFRLRVYGYVVMPEHVHLLLSEPERGLLADALKSLKQGVARWDAKDEWRSSASGRQGCANEQLEDSVQPSNFPTQANTGLEWATRPAVGITPATAIWEGLAIPTRSNSSELEK